MLATSCCDDIWMLLKMRTWSDSVVNGTVRGTQKATRAVTLDSEPGTLLRARAPVAGLTLPWGRAPGSLPVALWEVSQDTGGRPSGRTPLPKADKRRLPPLLAFTLQLSPLRCPGCLRVFSLPLQQSPVGTRRRASEKGSAEMCAHRVLGIGAGRGGLGCSGSVSEGRSVARTGVEKGQSGTHSLTWC